MSVMPMRLHLRSDEEPEMLDLYFDVYKEDNRYNILFPRTGRGSRQRETKYV
jgi:hypothetical protein